MQRVEVGDKVLRGKWETRCRGRPQDARAATFDGRGGAATKPQAGPHFDKRDRSLAPGLRENHARCVKLTRIQGQTKMDLCVFLGKNALAPAMLTGARPI